MTNITYYDKLYLTNDIIWAHQTQMQKQIKTNLSELSEIDTLYSKNCENFSLSDTSLSSAAGSNELLRLGKPLVIIRLWWDFFILSGLLQPAVYFPTHVIPIFMTGAPSAPACWTCHPPTCSDKQPKQAAALCFGRANAFIRLNCSRLWRCCRGLKSTPSRQSQSLSFYAGMPWRVFLPLSASPPNLCSLQTFGGDRLQLANAWKPLKDRC